VAVQQVGGGMENIYHVFLPKGTDVCLYGACYSPDNQNTFFFCAYQGVQNFPDVGFVLYTVEPYQNVQYCQEALPSPNGQLADSTYTALLHEVFETITDPGVFPFAYVNALTGLEIGDLCVSPQDSSGATMDPTLKLNGHPYAVQLVYRLSWKWRERLSVKIAERSYAKRAQALHG
jgi:hypothetical protein